MNTMLRRLNTSLFVHLMVEKLMGKCWGNRNIEVSFKISSSRKTLNMLYKLYVRPHLDYGDVIYQLSCKEVSSNSRGNILMQKLESVQYSAALAVTGTWKGTSREKLYQDLGWESLYLRRWSRRLFMIYKIINNLMPDYLRDPIPQLIRSYYAFRNQPVVGQIRARNKKYKSSFFPIC